MSKNQTVKVPLMPTRGRVIVLPEDKPKVTSTGLYLADTGSSSEKPQFGTIMRVGEPKLDEKGNATTSDLKEGMKVMFRKYSGDEVEFDGKKYIIMEEDAIMAVIED